MKSHEAISACVGRHTTSIARELHLSTSLLHKWQEPNGDWSDSGAHNPLDRIFSMVRRSVELGQGEDAYEPVRWLCERFGYVAVRVPASGADPTGLTNALLGAVKDLGDVSREVQIAIGDGKLTKAEARKVEVEIMDLIRTSMGMLHLVRGAQ